MHISQVKFEEIFKFNDVEIPSYQRDYEWKKDNVKELFEDLINTSKEKEKEYFLGILIVKTKYNDSQNTRKLIIIDGQQRIRTIAMFFIIVERYFEFLKENNNQKQNEKIINSLEQYKKFFILKDMMKFNSPESENTWNNIKIFLSNIKMENSFANEIKKAKKIKNLSIIASFFDKELNEKNNEFSERILNVLNSLKEIVKFVVLSVEEHENESFLFEKINTNSIPLNEWDLVKNYLISKTKENKNNKNLENEILNYTKDLENSFSELLPKNKWFEERENQISTNTKLFISYIERVILGSKTLTAKKRFSEYKIVLSNEFNLEKNNQKGFNYINEFISSKNVSPSNYETDLKKELRPLIFTLFVSMKFNFTYIASAILFDINKITLGEKTMNNKKIDFFTMWIIIFILNSFVISTNLPETLKKEFFKNYRLYIKGDEESLEQSIKETKKFYTEKYKDQIYHDSWKNKAYKLNKNEMNFYKFISKMNWDKQYEQSIDFFRDPNLNKNNNSVNEIKWNSFSVEHVLNQTFNKDKMKKMFNYEWTKKEHEENKEKVGNIFFIKHNLNQEKENCKSWEEIKKTFKVFKNDNFSDEEIKFLLKQNDWTPKTIDENSERILNFIKESFKKLDKWYF